jgi:hypothetical protein
VRKRRFEWLSGKRRLVYIYKKEILQALTFFLRDAHFHEKEKNGEHMDYFKSGFPVRDFTCLP